MNVLSKRNFRLFSVFLCVAILACLVSCNDQKKTEVWFMQDEFDLNLTQDQVLSALEALPSERYSLTQVDLFEGATLIYSLRDNITQDFCIVAFFDTVDAAHERFVYNSANGFSPWSSTYINIRVDTVVFEMSGFPARELLSELGVAVTETWTVDKKSDKRFVRSHLSREEILDYINESGLFISDFYEQGGFGKKTDGTCHFLIQTDTILGFPFTTLYDDFLTDNGQQIYYGKDYAVLCIGNDWLTILDEAEAYYAETE